MLCPHVPAPFRAMSTSLLLSFVPWGLSAPRMVLLFVAFAHVRVFHPHVPHTRHNGPPACWRFASAAITRLLFSCHHHDQWPFSRLRAPHAGSSLLACRPVGQGTQLSAICRSRICSRKSQFERPVGLQVGVWRVGGRCGVCGRAPPRCQARWADLQAHNGRYHHPPCVLVCAARGPMAPIAPTWAYKPHPRRQGHDPPRTPGHLGGWKWAQVGKRVRRSLVPYY